MGWTIASDPLPYAETAVILPLNYFWSPTKATGHVGGTRRYSGLLCSMSTESPYRILWF